MKDYTLGKEESRDFITGYEILEDSINVFYADGHNEHKEKNQQELDKIVFQLERQVKESDKCANDIRFKIASHLKAILGLAVTLLIATPILFDLNMIGTLTLTDLFGSLLLTYEVIKVNKHNSVLKDIKKNLDFLENRKEIISNIQENPMTLTNTTRKTQESLQECAVRDRTLDEDMITFNDLENISQRDMDMILINIQDLNSTGQVSFESDDKPYTIRPKR